MIKLIFKQIWNERKSNAWLWTELLIVFVALWVVVDWTYVNLHTYFQPRGFNIENTYQLFFSKLNPQSSAYIPAEEKNTTDGDDFRGVLERLRRNPDILYVSCSQFSSPYNGSNSFTAYRYDTLKSEYRLRRQCTPDFFNVFQYENIDGSGSESIARAFEAGTIVVPSNFMEEQFPGGKDLLNQQIYRGNDTTHAYRVVAVTRPVRYSDFQPPTVAIYGAEHISENSYVDMSEGTYSGLEICIRTRPGVPTDFADKLLNDSPRLYNVGNCYIKNIQSMASIRNYFQMDTVNDLNKRAFIMLFLLVNIFLGIIGTFWYRTQQRRAELGLRIALGSSLSKLNVLLIGEGLLLLVLAVMPALVICYHVGAAGITDVWQMEWGIARFIPGIAITLILMVLMIVAGIWYPAYQAMKIRPAEALHEE